MHMDGIDKKAQARNVFKQVGRALNPMEYIRYYGYDSYQRVYDEITTVDTQMRDEAKQQKPEMRESIHQARMAMKNREYPKAMYYSWKVIEALENIFNPVSTLENIRKDMLAEFYDSQGLGQGELASMHETLRKKEPATSSDNQTVTSSDLRRLLYTTAAPDPELITQAHLVSEAGPVEWLKENIPTHRQMEGAMLDKIFRNRMGKQKEAARKALRIAENSLKTMKDIFSQLDTHRTDFSAYLETAKRFQDRISTFKQDLSQMYQEHFSQTVNEMIQAPEVGKIAPPVSVDENTEIAKIPTTPPWQNTESSSEPSTQGDLKEQTGFGFNAKWCDKCNRLNPLNAEVCDKCGEGSLQPYVAPNDLSMAAPVEVVNEGDLDTGTVTDGVKAAKYVAQLAKRARYEVNQGHRDIAGALLVKASDICDQFDDEFSADQFLRAAERMLQQ